MLFYCKQIVTWTMGEAIQRSNPIAAKGRLQSSACKIYEMAFTAVFA
jgi:hypothetical protein